jgi:hypothetical protein
MSASPVMRFAWQIDSRIFSHANRISREALIR